MPHWIGRIRRGVVSHASDDVSTAVRVGIRGKRYAGVTVIFPLQYAGDCEKALRLIPESASAEQRINYE